MNFDLSEEQRMLQATIDQFLEDQCPVATIRSFYETEDEFIPTVWKGLAELGFAGLPIPEQYGGAGLELLDLQCAAERLGFHATPVPFFAHAVASLAIALGGSDEQKEAWLPRLASGDGLATIAFAETDGRWQPEDWSLAPDADGTLTGIRASVPAARAADVVVVGLDGGRLGLLDPKSSEIQIEPSRDLDHTRRLSTLALAGAPVELLPQGGAISAKIRDAALVLLAADAVGGAERCVELSVDHAKQREQFGRTIGHFQALKHQLANLALDSEPCRPLAWYAAYAWDRASEDAAQAAAHAKSHITDRFLQVARGTVEAHGGIGYTWESEVHYWLKRAVFDRTFLGTPRIHRMRAANLAGW